ncbi:MAG: hypothetical protein JRH20_18115 [Deltaproteobacteria bacterium]|nr:hypothetical protein [Deltaproteobacteria bacterium]
MTKNRVCVHPLLHVACVTVFALLCGCSGDETSEVPGGDASIGGDASTVADASQHASDLSCTCQGRVCGTNACGQSCGEDCPSGQSCDDGQCVDSCGPGTFECSGDCVDLLTDLENCGSCGKDCLPERGGAPICEQASCGIRCTNDVSLCPVGNLCMEDTCCPNGTLAACGGKCCGEWQPFCRDGACAKCAFDSCLRGTTETCCGDGEVCQTSGDLKKCCPAKTCFDGQTCQPEGTSLCAAGNHEVITCKDEAWVTTQSCGLFYCDGGACESAQVCEGVDNSYDFQDDLNDKPITVVAGYGDVASKVAILLVGWEPGSYSYAPVTVTSPGGQTWEIVMRGNPAPKECILRADKRYYDCEFVLSPQPTAMTGTWDWYSGGTSNHLNGWCVKLWPAN